MKIIKILLLTIIFFIAGCIIPPTYYSPTDTERHYDARGRYIGYSNSGESVTRHYDERGRYIGETRRSK